MKKEFVKRDDLRQCPFCGNTTQQEVVRYDGKDDHVWCSSCGARGPCQSLLPRADECTVFWGWNLRRGHDK